MAYQIQQGATGPDLPISLVKFDGTAFPCNGATGLQASLKSTKTNIELPLGGTLTINNGNTGLLNYSWGPTDTAYNVNPPGDYRFIVRFTLAGKIITPIPFDLTILPT